MSSTPAYVPDAAAPVRATPSPHAAVRSDGRAKPDDPLPRLIGNSPAMQNVLEQIHRFAACDIPVLITGEAGTGKKLVAHTIHANSRRRAAPFAAAHCSASPPCAIDLELFGRERGALPVADGRRGLLERTTGGTALLEEIGSLSPISQALLIRALEASEVIRLGGREPIRIDVRLMTTATVANPDAVAAPTLRPDLYYRLSVLRLHLPPLRERAADIEDLAMHLLRRIAGRLDRDLRGFSPEALAALRCHPWPGNARELISVIQRAVVLSPNTQIERNDLHFEEPAPATSESVRMPVRPPPGSAAELNLLLETLKRMRFSITGAARELNVSRVTLYRMLRRNGLELRQDAVVRGRAGGDDYQG